MSSDNKVNVDVKLGVNKFYVDEGHPHIILRSSPDMQEFNKLIKACPAGLYKLDDAGNIHFDSAGCRNAGPAGFSAAILFSKNGNTRRERSALSFATADALKHRITTLRRLIRLAPEITSFVLIENKSMSVTLTFDAARRKTYRESGYWGDASLGDYWRQTAHAVPDKIAVVDNHGASGPTPHSTARQAARKLVTVSGDSTGRSRGLSASGLV